MYDNLEELSKKGLFHLYLDKRKIAWHYMSGFLDGQGRDITPAFRFSELYAKAYVRFEDQRCVGMQSMLGCRDAFLAGRPIDMAEHELERAYDENRPLGGPMASVVAFREGVDRARREGDSQR